MSRNHRLPGAARISGGRRPRRAAARRGGLPRRAGVLALLPWLAGCHPLLGEYRVPAGVGVLLPERSGGACRVHEGGDALRTEPGDTPPVYVEATRAGRGVVRCENGDIALVVAPIARLTVKGPGVIKGDVELEVEALTARGEPFDLDLVSSRSVAWSHPDFLVVKPPRCGHMAALCSGFLGNGVLMRAYPLHERWGEGEIVVRVGDTRASLRVVAPRER
ncbi:hypothetical protein WME99_07195 [Sorangium sp. So ce136]|uniref:hypothetical protein n=1 Tax=Sorangium sp. So ce136 TaxID=3133284 RepID=UPI003EFBFE40